MWHLALKNLRGRKAYSSIIIIAVTVAVVMALLTFFLTSGIRQELENSRRVLGPDLAAVSIGNNDQLSRLLAGGAFSTVVFLTIFSVFGMAGAMFALMTIERKREFGLLKALGAQKKIIFKLIMIEASLLGSTGAALGAGIAAICLLCVHTGIVFPEIAPALPSSVVALRDMLACMAMTVGIAIVTALYPALAVSRMESYAAIRSGG